MKAAKKGKVYFIGAGAGSPDLITVRGLQKIKEADVILYDALLNANLLRYTRSNALKIFVGKRAGEGKNSAQEQEKIHQLIRGFVRNGKKVVRLKGGDSLLFSRGAEEGEFAHRQKLPFEFIPGITAASAAASLAGIPLTHRNYASSVAFVTGNEDPRKFQQGVQWKWLAQFEGTLVIYMGTRNLPSIARILVEHGKAASEPVAIVSRASSPDQQVLLSTLSAVQQLDPKTVAMPSLAIIGKVVRLHQNLRWFEKKPLYQKTILITRAQEEFDDFDAQLTELGAYPLPFPTIALSPVSDWSQVDQALQHLEAYTWLVFKSMNGVKLFYERLKRLQIDLRRLAPLKIATIGEKTREYFESAGLYTDFVPTYFDSKTLALELRPHLTPQDRVISFCSNLTHPFMSEYLQKEGIPYQEIPIYTIDLPHRYILDRYIPEVKQRLSSGTLDLITLMSSQTAKNLIILAQRYGMESTLFRIPIASIGKTTSDTLRQYQWIPTIEATHPTVDAMTQSLLQYFKRSKKAHRV